MRETGLGSRVAGVTLAALLAAGAAGAQDAQAPADGAAAEPGVEAGAESGAEGTPEGSSSNRVAVTTDWSVFVEDAPALECWGVSGPQQSVNTRDGQEVEVQRGDILLFVVYRPAAGVEGEVSFTGGYPFAENSTVSLQVGESSFEMFTQGEFAWPLSNEDDARIVEAMRRGAEVVLTGRSSRGTQTEDTFSLMGFSAALEEAQTRCAG